MKAFGHQLCNILNEPIEELNLDSEARRFLSEASIQTVGDLVQKTRSELEQSLPLKPLEDVSNLLASVGLEFGMQFDESGFFVDPATGLRYGRVFRRKGFYLSFRRTAIREGVPSAAEYLLYLFLPTNDRKCLPGDLAEEYATYIVPKFGRRRADFWYWKQVITSIWPILWPRIRRLATATATLRILEAIRRAAMGN